MKLRTQQSTQIIHLLRAAKRFKVLDNFQDEPVELPKTQFDNMTKKEREMLPRFARIKAKTVQIMDRKTRKRLTFNRADFNRARYLLGLT